MTEVATGRRRRSRQGLIGAILVILNLIAFNYLSSGHFLRVDLTESRIYTLSPDTLRILGKMDDLITIKYFLTRDLPPGYLAFSKQTQDLVEEFRIAAKGRIQVVYLDPSDGPETALEAEQYGIPKVPLPQVGAESYEEKMATIGLAILYEDRFESIPVVVDPVHLEYDLLLKIVRVLERTPAVVAFAQGGDTRVAELPDELRNQLESSQTRRGRHDIEGDYKEISQVLQRQYDVQAVDLGERLPGYVATLIVSDPALLDEKARYHVDQFLMRGGKLVLLLPGVAVDLSRSLQAELRDDSIDDWLGHYGIEMGRHLVMDRRCSLVPFQQGLGVKVKPYPPFIRITREGIEQESPITGGVKDMMLPFCSAIILNPKEGARASVLVRSSEAAWIEADRLLLDPEEIRLPPEEALQTFALAGIVEGEFLSYFAGRPVPDSVYSGAAADSATDPTHPSDMLLRSTRTAILVVGSSDFIGRQVTTRDRSVQYYNYQFFSNAVDYLTMGEAFGQIRSRSRPLRYIAPEFKEDFEAIALFKILGTAGGAFLVICLGLIRFYLRK